MNPQKHTAFPNCDSNVDKLNDVTTFLPGTFKSLNVKTLIYRKLLYSTKNKPSGLWNKYEFGIFIFLASR